MGGHQAGEVASSTALEALRAAVTGGEQLRDAIVRANDAVWEKSGADEGLRGMGTTLTAGTMAAGGTLLIGHVGDSRAYLLRDGELRQVTSDHSLVAELVEAGELTEEQAELDPHRSMITRALGVEPGVDVDLIPLELLPGDRVLLCSDGLTTMVREDQILAVLRREVDPTRAANALVDAANADGGADNITTVVVDVVEGGGAGDVPALVDAAPVNTGSDGAVDPAGDPTAPLGTPIAGAVGAAESGLVPGEPAPGDSASDEPEAGRGRACGDRRGRAGGRRRPRGAPRRRPGRAPRRPAGAPPGPPGTTWRVARW